MMKPGEEANLTYIKEETSLKEFHFAGNRLTLANGEVILECITIKAASSARAMEIFDELYPELSYSTLMEKWKDIFDADLPPLKGQAIPLTMK